MIRTQIYITEEEKKGLESLSSNTGKSQSELIRSAIDSFIESNQQKNKKSILKNSFGMWKNNKFDFEASRKSLDR